MVMMQDHANLPYIYNILPTTGNTPVRGMVLALFYSSALTQVRPQARATELGLQNLWAQNY
jgi:hypothetical protein